MPTYPFRLSRSRRLLLALLLAFSGSLFAQELSVAPLVQPSSREPEQAAVNVASIEPLPRALGNARTFASGLALPASPGSMAVVSSAPVVARPKEFALHPFWDRENRVLFTAVGALAAADFCTTRANLARGGKRTESRDSRVQRQHSGARDKPRSGNFEYDWNQLHVAQNRSPQAGADYIIRQYWHLCRSCGVWPDPSIVPRYRLVVPVAAVLLLDFDILSRP